jgi:hypothetical protein
MQPQSRFCNKTLTNCCIFATTLQKTYPNPSIHEKHERHKKQKNSGKSTSFQFAAGSKILYKFRLLIYLVYFVTLRASTEQIACLPRFVLFVGNYNFYNFTTQYAQQMPSDDNQSLLANPNAFLSLSGSSALAPYALPLSAQWL